MLQESTESSELINSGEVPKKKSITTFGLLFITYFVTCGGPFGIEAAVRCAGPLYTLVAILFILAYWCFPQAVFAAELSTMFTENGGSVLWVQHAFGDFFGYLNAQTMLLNNMSGLAITIGLFVRYLDIAFGLSYGETWALRLVFIATIVALNIAGLEFLEKLSPVIFVFVFLPFVAEFAMIFVMGTASTMRFDSLLQIPQWKDFYLGEFIGMIVWATGGFDNLGSLAGEVEDPATYFWGILCAFPLIVVNYFAPIILCYLVYPHFIDWTDNAFVQIAFSHFPIWVGRWMTVASAVCCFAQYNSSMIVVSRFVWAMAIGKKAGLVEHRYFPLFLAYSKTNCNSEEIPVAGILFTGVVTLLLSLLNQNYLVEVFLILRVVNLLLEYGSFIYLKHSQPNRERPIEVPFGVVGAVLLVIPTILIAGVAIAFSSGLSLLLGAVATICIAFSYFFKVLWVYGTHRLRDYLKERESYLVGDIQTVEKDTNG